MTSISARIMLSTFIFSISLFPLLEGGHQLLHSFKSRFHAHQISKPHHYHTLTDHALKQSLPVDKVNESADGSNFICLLFGLFKQDAMIHDLRIVDIHKHFTGICFFYSAISPSPSTPPPL